MSDDRLRRELEALERAAPADLPPRPSVGAPRRWLRLAVPAAVMVMAGTLIGLSVASWIPGALPFGSRVGELVPLPTTPPPPSGMPQLCMQAYIEGTLVRDAEYGFALAHGDLTTPVRWPHGYVAREGSDGLELLDATGEIVAREGDIVEMGGGGNGIWIACPGPTVIPREFSGRFEGDPDMEDGCIWLLTDSGRHWPIAWPDGYREEFRDGHPVLLHHEEVIGEAGDEITVRGAPGDVGFACIGFSSYVVTDVVGVDRASPVTPSPMPSHIPGDPAATAGEDGTLSLAGTWAECCYIEGAMTYVSLAGPTALDDRPFMDGDELSLATGHYLLTLYHRPCSLNCDFKLDAPRGHCIAEFDVVAGSKLRATIVWMIDGPCDVSIDG